ncbi:MAG: DUF929 family protein, partial [Candidatus Micrarchaeaceae archaeon]
MKSRTFGVLFLILVIAAVLIALAFKGKPVPIDNYIGKKVNASFISQLYSIANSNASYSVGIGTAGNLPKAVNSTLIEVQGKPAVVYIGAEYCPFCAAERWALIIALMRFGNLSNISYMVSSPTDIAGP